MSTLTLAYAVHTYSSGTHGRAICNARTHHFVSDDVGGDAVGAGELFLSGVSACAVNMVERLAKQDQIPLQWMHVRVEAYRAPDASPGASRLASCDPERPRDTDGVRRGTKAA